MWISEQTLKQIKNDVEMIKKWQLDINELKATLDYRILEFIRNNTTPLKLSPEQEARLKELELWQNKLHSLMIEKTPANKEKLSKNYSFLRGRML